MSVARLPRPDQHHARRPARRVWPVAEQAAQADLAWRAIRDGRPANRGALDAFAGVLRAPTADLGWARVDDPDGLLAQHGPQMIAVLQRLGEGVSPRALSASERAILDGPLSDLWAALSAT